jgi:hypothetical protein
MSDPNAVKEALDAAIDAFNEEGHGIPTRESEIETNGVGVPDTYASAAG